MNLGNSLDNADSNDVRNDDFDMPNQDPLSSTISDNDDGLPNEMESDPLSVNSYERFRTGTKVAPGKEIDKYGQVRDSSTKRLARVAGQAAAAYATGGQSLGNDQKLKNNGLVDNSLGVVSDKAEKVPGVKEMADELDEAGVIDATSDAMDLAGNIKNGDIEGTIQKGGDFLKSSDKMQKNIKRKLMLLIISSAGGFLLFIIVIIGIIAPVAGGFIDITDLLFSTAGDEAVKALEVYFANLPEEQRVIVLNAVSALGKNYADGGHPTGPGFDGFPSTGLDSAGFVQWVLWTAYEENPGELTTCSISDLIGTKFQEISEDQLQPGDIGLKFKSSTECDNNHTGIYLTGGVWIHAAGEKSGVISNKYKDFTIYLRYVKE